MAYASTHDAAASPLPRVRAALAAIGHALVSLAATDRRLRALERFQRMDDAELARRGMTRHDIARHVFRDAGLI